MKLHWENLTSIERAEYMYLQMAPSHECGGGGMLPDDCSECGGCGTPMLGGGGLCSFCYSRWKALRDKLGAEVKE